MIRTHFTVAKLALSAILVAGLISPSSAAPLDRSKVVLPSAVAVDLAANTVTLKLHRGSAKGATVWYIITDASDLAAAEKTGAIYSSALADVGDAEEVEGDPSSFHFAATVDFTPRRVLSTSPEGDVTEAHAGSVGEAGYTPFVRTLGSNVVYNAPIVASGEHPRDVTEHTDTLDRIVAIDTRDASNATATFVLARGFTAGKPVAYISTDASDQGAAAIERCTYAPRLAKTARASRVPIFVFFAGRTDAEGQGIPYAALRGHLGSDATPANAASLGSPLNIQSTFPGVGSDDAGYTPLWEVQAGVWTSAARSSGKARQLRTPEAVTAEVHAGSVTGPGGKPFGNTGILVNCPVVAYVDERPH
jgi:hypothetical protein